MQAQSLLHFEMGAMGSSLGLSICGKFHLPCHRIYWLHTRDTVFCWGWPTKLGVCLPVLGFSVPECYVGLCFRDLLVATTQ